MTKSSIAADTADANASCRRSLDRLKILNSKLWYATRDACAELDDSGLRSFLRHVDVIQPSLTPEERLAVDDAVSLRRKHLATASRLREENEKRAKAEEEQQRRIQQILGDFGPAST